MIGLHLPALQVVLPLAAAALCAMLRRPFAAWALATATSWIAVLIATLLLARVMAEGPISYWLGSWQPPWGIEYRIDAASALLLLLVSGIGAIIMPYARLSVGRDVAPESQPWYYATYLLCLTGLLGMSATGDAFNVFVFMEVASLSSYILIALGRDRRALFAAYQYLVLGTIGATFFIIGVGFLYVVTGTLNMADLAARLATVEDARPVIVGIAFLAVGLGLKSALFPLHYWLPNAYAYAPSVSTAFLAATATKVAIYLLLRFFFTVLGPGMPFAGSPIATIWIAMSVAAMVLASVTAIHQAGIKRMLAYSSVAQIGYITLGIGLASEMGLTGALVHLFNHAVMKGALFLLIGGAILRGGDVSLDALAGLARRMPATFAGIVIAGLSLIGVPGTVGFVGKWLLVAAALEQGLVWLAIVIVGSSALAVVYVWRIVEAACFKPAPAETEFSEMPPSMLIPAWVLVGFCLYFGLDTSLTTEVAGRAARLLITGVPG